jgi:hypothetical protein
MINQQYHKGQACKIQPVFCQEGYCSECSIYQVKYSRLETVNRGLMHSYLTDSERTPNLVSTRNNS